MRVITITEVVDGGFGQTHWVPTNWEDFHTSLCGVHEDGCVLDTDGDPATVDCEQCAMALIRHVLSKDLARDRRSR